MTTNPMNLFRIENIVDNITTWVDIWDPMPQRGNRERFAAVILGSYATKCFFKFLPKMERLQVSGMREKR